MAILFETWTATNPGTGSINSPAYDISLKQNASVIASFTDGAAAGTLKLQGSNDAPTAQMGSGFAPTTWVDIPSATASVTAGATTVITLSNICHMYVRVVFASTAGAGTLTAKLKAGWI